MAKRGVDALADTVELPDDVLAVTFVHLLGNPVLNHRWDFSVDEATALMAYFRLPLVSRAFCRVFSRLAVDWKAMLGTRWMAWWPEVTPALQAVTRMAIYQKIELERIHNYIDTVVATEHVTYRTPVTKQVSRGKLSLKKLRRAIYPSATVKADVLAALRCHERLCRQRRALRAKHPICI